MYNERETEILLKLASNKEEWTHIGIMTLKHDEVLNLIKDGLVEVNGKDMKITDFGRNFLKEIEKS
jgi:coproporphyrinogen III oxidase-like Fe-S oxidoreductase